MNKRPLLVLGFVFAAAFIATAQPTLYVGQPWTPPKDFNGEVKPWTPPANVPVPGRAWTPPKAFQGEVRPWIPPKEFENIPTTWTPPKDYKPKERIPVTVPAGKFDTVRPEQPDLQPTTQPINSPAGGITRPDLNQNTAPAPIIQPNNSKTAPKNIVPPTTFVPPVQPNTSPTQPTTQPNNRKTTPKNIVPPTTFVPPIQTINPPIKFPIKR